jgi:hypothetical protein
MLISKLLTARNVPAREPRPPPDNILIVAGLTRSIVGRKRDMVRPKIDLVVWGKPGEAAAPVQRPVTAPSPRAVAAAGRQVSDAPVSAKTYSTCMALFRDRLTVPR